MDPQKAAALTDAIMRTGHPRNDYRTEEAKRFTHWLEIYAQAFITPSDWLIDLGCAAGKQTFAAERLGARVVGLDCAFEALRLAKSVAADTGSQARFVLGNYVLLPFAAQSFEVALFPKNLVECSYTEAEALAAEIARLLKPGGRLILTLPDSLLQYTAGSQLLAHYDAQTGRSTPQVTIPGQGEFENQGYFWTCAFAVHVFSRHLNLLQVTRMDNTTFLLVFTQAREV